MQSPGRPDYGLLDVRVCGGARRRNFDHPIH